MRAREPARAASFGLPLSPLNGLAPGPQERPRPAVDRVFARTRDLGDCNERFFAVLRCRADIERAGGWVSSDHKKIVARFKALVSCPRREDRNITRFQDERTPFGAAEPDAPAAARDAEHFMDAGVVMSIIVDAIAP